MELSFDIKGHLKPYDLIEVNWATFVETFVHSFDESSTRYQLLEHFERFIEDTKNIINAPFEIWINGSFTTLRENPKDIDVLFCISNTLIINELRKFIYENQRHKKRKIDAYVLEVLPENHKDYAFYFSDTKYWLFHFGNTRTNHQNKSYPKGILKIKF